MRGWRPVVCAALCLLALLGGLALSAAPAAASIIVASVALPSCQTATGTVGGCTDTGYLQNSTVTATSGFIGGNVGGTDASLYSFENAFANWNAVNGDNWTLALGGTLNVTLSASLGLGAGTTTGGFGDVIVTIGGATQSQLNELAWTQALVTNYTPTGGLATTPTVTLDTYSLSYGSTNSGTAFTSACEALPTPGPNNTAPSAIPAVTGGKAYCDPIYPFQYASAYNGSTLDGVALTSNFFYDAPQGPWPNATFRAVTLLSTVTYTTNAADQVTGRTLTVYQGVAYGFSLSVPEPASAALLLPALPLLWWLRRGAPGTPDAPRRTPSPPCPHLPRGHA